MNPGLKARVGPNAVVIGHSSAENLSLSDVIVAGCGRKVAVCGMEQGASAPVDGQIVDVRHVAGGWTVSNALLGEALMFLSRQQAESHAKTFACHLTRLGLDSRVDLHDQDNASARTIWFWGEFEPEPETEAPSGA